MRLCWGLLPGLGSFCVIFLCFLLSGSCPNCHRRWLPTAAAPQPYSCLFSLRRFARSDKHINQNKLQRKWIWTCGYAPYPMSPVRCPLSDTPKSDMPNPPMLDGRVRKQLHAGLGHNKRWRRGTRSMCASAVSLTFARLTLTHKRHGLALVLALTSALAGFGKLKKKTALESARSTDVNHSGTWLRPASYPKHLPPTPLACKSQLLLLWYFISLALNILQTFFSLDFNFFLHFLTVAVGCCAPKVNGVNKAGQTAKWNGPKWNGMELVMDLKTSSLEMVAWQDSDGNQSPMFLITFNSIKVWKHVVY